MTSHRTTKGGVLIEYAADEAEGGTEEHQTAPSLSYDPINDEDNIKLSDLPDDYFDDLLGLDDDAEEEQTVNLKITVPVEGHSLKDDSKASTTTKTVTSTLKRPVTPSGSTPTSSKKPCSHPPSQDKQVQPPSPKYYSREKESPKQTQQSTGIKTEPSDPEEETRSGCCDTGVQCSIQCPACTTHRKLMETAFKLAEAQPRNIRLHMFMVLRFIDESGKRGSQLEKYQSKFEDVTSPRQHTKEAPVSKIPKPVQQNIQAEKFASVAPRTQRNKVSNPNLIPLAGKSTGITQVEGKPVPVKSAVIKNPKSLEIPSIHSAKVVEPKKMETVVPTRGRGGQRPWKQRASNFRDRLAISPWMDQLRPNYFWPTGGSQQWRSYSAEQFPGQFSGAKMRHFDDYSF